MKKNDEKNDFYNSILGAAKFQKMTRVRLQPCNVFGEKNLAFFNIDLACFNVDLFLKTDVLTSMPAALPALWPPNASLN